jgi:hypothetical protein
MLPFLVSLQWYPSRTAFLLQRSESIVVNMKLGDGLIFKKLIKNGRIHCLSLMFQLTIQM